MDKNKRQTLTMELSGYRVQSAEKTGGGEVYVDNCKSIHVSCCSRGSLFWLSTIVDTTGAPLNTIMT